MEFIVLDLETVLGHLNSLNPDTKALWGNMSAQRMVEHLTDTLNLSIGIGDRQLEIPEEKVTRAVEFLKSEHPMPKNFQASFAKENTPLRNEELELAIDEFVQAWIMFNDYYDVNPDQLIIHPNFGALDRKLWERVHSKHITHHLEQFGMR